MLVHRYQREGLLFLLIDGTSKISTSAFTRQGSKARPCGAGGMLSGVMKQ
jgi:hypothetical protein